MSRELRPFGEVSCEKEIAILEREYENYYFRETPFNQDAIKPRTYLIVGRRGSGKTSLSHYFSFQREIENSVCIDVDEPQAYGGVLAEIERRILDEVSGNMDLAIDSSVKVWTLVIWTLLCSHFQDSSASIRAACAIRAPGSSAAGFVRAFLRAILEKLLGSGANDVSDALGKMLESPTMQMAQSDLRRLTSKTPVIIAIDSLEQYDIDNEAIMIATAALVQAASRFHDSELRHGIMVKAFMTAEVFPYLQEAVLSNPSKHVEDPLYLHWRPKDLLRLVSWRFYRYLTQHRLIGRTTHDDIDWSDFRSVRELAWDPYFGESIESGTGILEDSFPYILRHTQMRPRQLVKICNAIADGASHDPRFPRFDRTAIREQVSRTVVDLATEVINSYSRVYRDVDKIARALTGMQMTFKGRELDRVARTSAASWPPGRYSADAFRRLVAELGIVGTIRTRSDSFVTADFEYFKRDRVVIDNNADCVVHPMFFEKFNIDVRAKTQVLPFPDHPSEWHGQ